jgi:hypothetical protein
MIALANQLRDDVLAWLKKHHPELIPEGWYLIANNYAEVTSHGLLKGGKW